MKRKIIAVLLSIMIITAFMPAISFAAAANFIVTGISSEGEISPGQEITAKLSIPLSKKVSCATATIMFDNTVLELTGIKTTGVGKGGLSATTPKDAANENGMVRFAFASAEAVAFDSTFILEVSFKVKSNVPNGSVAKLIYVDKNEGYSFEDGSQKEISVGNLSKYAYSAKVVSGIAQSGNQTGGIAAVVQQTEKQQQEKVVENKSETTVATTGDAITQATEDNIEQTTEEAITASKDTEKNQKTIVGVTTTKVTAKAQKAKKGIKLTWTKTGKYKVDYYEIYRSTKKNSGYKKIYTTKSGSTKVYTNSKNLKKGTTYYYRIRGVRVIYGDKCYTEWSNKISKKW